MVDPMPPEDINLAAMAETLGKSPDYRVLRRLVLRTEFTPCEGQATKTGIMLDVEKTGLDTARDEVIELAMVKYTRGNHRPDRYYGWNGRRASDCALAAVRPEAWACSATEVEWRKHGFDGSRQGYLLAGVGLFHQAHRAIDDCRALVEILASNLPKPNRSALAVLLGRARRKTMRIWAEQISLWAQGRIEEAGLSMERRCWRPTAVLIRRRWRRKWASWNRVLAKHHIFEGRCASRKGDDCSQQISIRAWYRKSGILDIMGHRTPAPMIIADSTISDCRKVGAQTGLPTCNPAIAKDVREEDVRRTSAPRSS